MIQIVYPDRVNWDAFRDVYKDLTFKQLNKICDDIDKLYPVQHQHHAIHFSRMLSQLPDNLTIIELGCHQGELANRMFNGSNKIKSWVGYDFKAPLRRNMCLDKRYSMVSLGDWFHETKLPECDVFLASHVLEHLSESQVKKTLNHCNAEYFLLEVPLNEEGRDWHGWGCTHVLEWGLKHLRAWLNNNGLNIFYEIPVLGIIGAKKCR